MTNEPTTGEIVRALRCDGDANNCVDCRYATYDTATILCDQEQNVRDAADRLESQEAQIKQLAEALAYANEWHKESVENATNELRELSGIAGELEAMTARAESAERERDAIALELDMMRANENENGLCLICKKKCAQAANGCFFCKDFEWRGLQPHDGVGK